MRTNKDKAITKIQCAMGEIFSNPKRAREFLKCAIEYLSNED